MDGNIFSPPDPPDPFGSGELLSPLSVRRPLTFHILINSFEATGPIWTNLWWNGPWMAPFQNCVRRSRLPTKMATKLKIEKRVDEILIVHCCFSGDFDRLCKLGINKQKNHLKIFLLETTYLANFNQTLSEWSLGGPLSKLCPSVPSCIQDGHCYKK